MSATDNTPLDPRKELALEPEQMPHHIAIIMDGNGRWANQRNLPRIRGHEEGAESVRVVVTRCARLGIEALTLYSFSAENWKRPKEEVEFLMELCGRYLVAERDNIMRHNIRLIHVGRSQGLTENVVRELNTTIDLSRNNTGLTLCLALNYGARAEIVDAVRSIARRVRDGKLDIGNITEDVVSRSLYTADVPDPDLLIRTSSEFRVSNFLLWQISYSEIHVTDVLWPDFRTPDLYAAIKDYARRDRRYGGIEPTS